MVNKERAAQKLGPLTMDPLLILVAREHSHEMMEKNYFDHRSPTPGLRTPMDRYLKALGERPPYACVGENLYYCSVADVERSHRALMASLSHRDNILFSRFEKMGVGIYQNDRGEFWVTQMFLTSCDPRAGKTSPSRPPETKQAEAQSAPSAPPDKPASAPPAEAAKSAPTSAPPAESEKPAPDSAGPPSGGAP
ncbi:MAG: hypothetical protein HY320_06340 [Armatimonadetes bacterium]|nr:hypothetical protein [Armatimonadota bacterium]